ncbi:MAG TPA: hypothetical protein VEA78_05415 [Acidimicrobiales bacterium]|nr:hypothetical protein [Acidimicrobiales bacterium]
MLPESLDPDALKTIAIVVLVVLLVVAFLVMRFIQKMVLRVILLGAIVGVGVGVWVQRENLQDCVPECACEFFGMEVPLEAIPGCEPQAPAG